MKNVLASLLRVLLRIFFRRVEVAGGEGVPAEGALLFVLNHQNGLVDPMVLLGLAPRRSVFLAKAPLFDMPVIGLLVKAFGSIPIHRRMDGATDPAQNDDTFRHVWLGLERGQAIAIFPEGTSHSDSSLKRFKTGAARIALGAAGVSAQGRVVHIVPAGLYYTTKTTFRSSVLLYFGRSIAVEPTEATGPSESAHDRVVDLTSKLERALAEVTLQADRHEALALVTRAERIFSSAGAPGQGELDLVSQFEVRRRFLEGYAELRAKAPERLEELEHMIARHEAKLSAARINASTLMPAQVHLLCVAVHVLTLLGVALLLLPVGLVGFVVNYPAYRLTGPLATRVLTPDADVVATQKILAGALVFPIVWATVGLLVGQRFGWWAGLAAAIAAPLSGYVALRLLERLDYFVGEVRGLVLRLSRPTTSLQLVAEGRAIREAILALQDEAAAGRT